MVQVILIEEERLGDWKVKEVERKQIVVLHYKNSVVDGNFDVEENSIEGLVAENSIAVENSTVEKAVENSTVEKAVENSTVEKAVENSTVEKAVENSTVEKNL